MPPKSYINNPLILVSLETGKRGMCALMIMSFTFFNSVLQRLSLSPRWPLVLYAATWTVILTVLVAVASFSPELAFVSAITPSSTFSEPCRRDRERQGGAMTVRVPLDVPGEVFCVPAHLFRRSKLDLLVPPVFAAVIVATSAYVVRVMGLWETDDPRD